MIACNGLKGTYFVLLKCFKNISEINGIFNIEYYQIFNKNDIH